MRFVVAGASGFLGTAWTRQLQAQGHEVVRLVRRAAGTGESQWDPYAGKVDRDLVEQADVVANLAGAPLAHFPWTRSYCTTFAESRVLTTQTLAEAIAASERKPTFLAQNGVAGYGDRGDELVTEDVPTEADSFLGRVTVEWEAATAPAREAGARVVVLRTAVVLHRSGGILKQMRLPFALGLGAQIGDGKQYFATISLQDWLRATTFLAETATAHGAYNLSAPAPTTNREYTKALARRLGRPAMLRVPTLPIRLVAAPVASEATGSIRVIPQRLLDEGFVFHHPTIEERLHAALAD